MNSLGLSYLSDNTLAMPASSPEAGIKAIFTFKGTYSTHFMTNGYEYTAWLLAVTLARLHFQEVELITDSAGEKLLVDTWALPFTGHNLALESYQTKNPLFKGGIDLAACKMQTTPFVLLQPYIFLWEKPNGLADGVIVQSNEAISTTVEYLLTNWVVPQSWRGQRAVTQLNTGVVGFNDLEIMRKWVREVEYAVERLENFTFWSTHNLIAPVDVQETLLGFTLTQICNANGATPTVQPLTLKYTNMGGDVQSPLCNAQMATQANVLLGGITLPTIPTQVVGALPDMTFWFTNPNGMWGLLGQGAPGNVLSLDQDGKPFWAQGVTEQDLEDGLASIPDATDTNHGLMSAIHHALVTDLVANGVINIEAASQSYLEFNPNTRELKVKALGMVNVVVDSSGASSLVDWMTATAYTGTQLQEGDHVILPAASLAYVHNGGGSGTASDFVILEQPPLSNATVRTMFGITANSGLTYNVTTGEFSTNKATIADVIAGTDDGKLVVPASIPNATSSQRGLAVKVWEDDGTNIRLSNPTPSNPRYHKTLGQKRITGQTWHDRDSNGYQILNCKEYLNVSIGSGVIHEINLQISRGEWETTPDIYGAPFILKFDAMGGAIWNMNFDLGICYTKASPVGSKIAVWGQLGESTHVPDVFVGWKPVDGNTNNDQLVVLVKLPTFGNVMKGDLFARYLYIPSADIQSRVPTHLTTNTTPVYATGWNGLAGLGTDCRIVTFTNRVNNMEVQGILSVTGGAAAIQTLSDEMMKEELTTDELTALEEFAKRMKEIPQVIRKYNEHTGSVIAGQLVVGWTAQQVLGVATKVKIGGKEDGVSINDRFGLVIQTSEWIDKNGKPYKDFSFKDLGDTSLSKVNLQTKSGKKLLAKAHKQIEESYTQQMRELKQFEMQLAVDGRRKLYLKTELVNQIVSFF